MIVQRERHCKQSDKVKRTGDVDGWDQVNEDAISANKERIEKQEVSGRSEEAEEVYSD